MNRKMNRKIWKARCCILETNDTQTQKTATLQASLERIKAPKFGAKRSKDEGEKAAGAFGKIILIKYKCIYIIYILYIIYIEYIEYRYMYQIWMNSGAEK